VNHDRSGLWTEPLDEFRLEPSAVKTATPEPTPPAFVLQDRREMWSFVAGSVFGALVCFILVSLTTSAEPRLEPPTGEPAPASSAPAPVTPAASEAPPPERAIPAPAAAPVVENAREAPALTTTVPDVRQAPVPAPRISSRNGTFVGSLRIDSTPRGARVFVNRLQVGVTPLVVPDLRAGSHAVRVEADGHVPWSSAIRVIADRQTSVHAPLAPLDP
jgi:hypothetical protein